MNTHSIPTASSAPDSSRASSSSARILVIEDDPSINDVVRTRLAKDGHTITSAFSGTEAQLLLESASFDLVISDLMLPGMTGEDIVTLIRETDPALPILILSARNAPADKVNLLQLGADDYLEKPFDLEELIARVNVQLRHVEQSAAPASTLPSTALTFHDWRLDPATRSFSAAGAPIQLTRTEFDMLHLLMEHPGRVFTKQELYEHTWSEPYTAQDGTVAAHISNLRSKLRAGGAEDHIQTVWGIGFKLS